jgi:hypothetical protein
MNIEIEEAVLRDAQLNAAADGAAERENTARIEAYAQMDEALRDGAAQLIDNDPRVRGPSSSGDIRELTVILGRRWRPVRARDSGRRRLTLFLNVARGLTFQRCVAAAFPRPPSVT